MGVDFADYNNDGWADVFVNALANQRYALYRNSQGKSFDYISGASGISGISQLHSGWGTRFFDYDNDGWKDLFIGQGHVMDNIELTQPSIRYEETPLLMRNCAGQFIDVSRSSGEPFRVPLTARGVAFGDLNNDGFLDLAINCNDRSPLVLMNQAGNGNHWLIIETIGTKSNRDGIGARLRLVGESGKSQYVLVSTAGSYLSASDKRAHFGLGADRMARLLEITWPSGTVQRTENIKADQVLVVREPVG
jgi:enediyne biosynthesis protein E4